MAPTLAMYDSESNGYNISNFSVLSSKEFHSTYVTGILCTWAVYVPQAVD